MRNSEVMEPSTPLRDLEAGAGVDYPARYNIGRHGPDIDRKENDMSQVEAELNAMISELADRVVDSYRPKIELASKRGDTPEMDRLYRSMRSDLDAAYAPLLELYKYNPPHACSITTDGRVEIVPSDQFFIK